MEEESEPQLDLSGLDGLLHGSQMVEHVLTQVEEVVYDKYLESVKIPYTIESVCMNLILSSQVCSLTADQFPEK